MHHHHFDDELFKARARELQRHAAISRLVACPPARTRVHATRVYGAVARRVWGLRGAPGLVP